MLDDGFPEGLSAGNGVRHGLLCPAGALLRTPDAAAALIDDRIAIDPRLLLAANRAMW